MPGTAVAIYLHKTQREFIKTSQCRRKQLGFHILIKSRSLPSETLIRSRNGGLECVVFCKSKPLANLLRC